MRVKSLRSKVEEKRTASKKEVHMAVESCVPTIPSADLEKSLRFWVEGLGFDVGSQMRAEGKLIGFMLSKGNLHFWLNRRAGTPTKPEDYNGIGLYWAPPDIRETGEHLKGLGFGVSEIVDRDYGQTEFFLTDDDGFTHCFGVTTGTTRRASALTAPKRLACWSRRFTLPSSCRRSFGTLIESREISS
jgi:catechol 2,3-dioxygenase-like lactoylglutathione lyase family enzyme